MPTIEIVSIDSTRLELNQADFDFAIIEESKLESHRGLFYDFLRQHSGVIVHIGNPDFKLDKESGFIAGEIIDWDFEPRDIIIAEVNLVNPIENLGAIQQYRFKFLEQYKSDIDKLLKIALDNSPIKKIYFLTDYQFGPKTGRSEIINTIKDFWLKHDKHGLNLNTLYEMYD